jgi:hypothetical protein
MLLNFEFFMYCYFYVFKSFTFDLNGTFIFILGAHRVY